MFQSVPGATHPFVAGEDMWRYVDDGATPAIDLYPTRPLVLGAMTPYMYGRTLSVSFDEGGMSAIATQVRIDYKDSNGENSTYVYTDPDVQAYLDADGRTNTQDVRRFEIQELVLPDGSERLMDRFAINYMAYMKEPQMPVTFTAKETDGTTWKALFQTVSQADSIWDRSSGVDPVTNRSLYGGARRFQKLYLSKYQRNFPDPTSEYTWGVVNDVDLSNTIASNDL